MALNHRTIVAALLAIATLTACSDPFGNPPLLTLEAIEPTSGPNGTPLTLIGTFPPGTTFTICGEPLTATLLIDEHATLPHVGVRGTTAIIATAIIPELTPGATCPITAQHADTTATGPTFAVDPITPDAPTIESIRARPTTGEIEFEAIPPTYDGGAPITGYEADLGDGTWRSTTARDDMVVIDGVTPGDQHQVRIRAINRAGGGTPSDPTPLTITEPPTPPTDLTITPGDGFVTIRFQYDPDAAFHLDVRIDDGPWQRQPFTDDTPDPTAVTTAFSKPGRSTVTTPSGTTVSISTRFTGPGGTSTPTPPITVTPSPPPSPPTGITLTAGDATIAVAWNAPTASANPVTHHTATATPGNATCTALMPALTCTIDALPNGVTYTVTVTATNAVGTSAVGTPVQGTPMGVPSTPTNLTVTANALTLTVAWDAASPNGTPILGYTATLDPGGAQCTTTPPTTTCTFTNLTPGTTYTAGVTATNAVGTGAPAISDPILIATTPTAPRSLLITEADTALIVRWRTPTSDGGAPITLYTATATPGDATCTTTDTTCIITGLTNDTLYQVTLTATNAIGASPAATGEATPRPDVSVPSAPTNPTATPDPLGYALNVAWNPPTNDGKSPILTYQATATPGNFTCTATHPTTTCDITGLDNDTTYTITITATNGIGESPTATTTGTTVDLESFVIVVDTTLGSFGTGANANTVNLPFSGAVDLTIDWGGAHSACVTTVKPVVSGVLKCTYDAPGTYTIKIRGSATEYGDQTAALYADKPYQEKILEVTSWGTLGFTRLDDAFHNAKNLIGVPDTLPSTVTSLWATFRNAETFDDPNVASWDVSNVTDFRSTFHGAKAFDQDLSDWDVSAGTGFASTFEDAWAFNQSVADWDMSAATVLSRTFANAKAFNNGCEVGDTTCPLEWTSTGGVTQFDQFLASALVFNQRVTLDTSAATRLDGLFQNTTVFNNGCAAGVRDDVNCGLDLDTSQVTNLIAIFGQAKAFNQRVEHWDTSAVTTLWGAFEDADAFNQSLSGWDTANVTTLEKVFNLNDGFNNGCAAGVTTCPLTWDTSKVTSMANAFSQATVFDQALDWNTSNVTSLNATFSGAVAFDQDISGWDTAKVTTLRYTFSSTAQFDQDLPWDTSSVTNMEGTFSTTSKFDGDITGWSTSSVTNMDRMFQNSAAFTGDLSGWCVSSIATAPQFFRLNSLGGFISPVWGTCGG